MGLNIKLRWLALAISLVTVCAGLTLWFLRAGTIMPGETFSNSNLPAKEPAPQLELRLKRHVEELAGKIGPRHMGRPVALEAAAAYIESEFRSYGYEPRRETFPVRAQEASNIYVELEGTSDQVVIFGAHYDTVPQSPGANDNATGVAAMLELARLHRSDSPGPTIRFIAFVNEEAPYFFTNFMGSRVHAQRSLQRNERIACMFSLETIGYYSDEAGGQRYPFPYSLFYPTVGNFVGFVGNSASKAELHRAIAAFRSEAAIDSEGLAAPRIIVDINRSDQISFWGIGAPAIMVTDTVDFRYEHYHLPTDTPEIIVYPEFAKVVDGLSAVVSEFMN